MRKQIAREVKPKHSQVIFGLGLLDVCVKSDLHLSWDAWAWRGTASWASTLLSRIISHNATFDVSPLHSVLKFDESTTE